jgi:sterol desaturase/sphingolipid hydroxylase (fatty acid hydroxylase superfamily)
VFLYGLVSWTLFEYLFHRYVFHFTPRGDFQKRVSFLFHGVHHQYPNDKKRLVMPVALSILIGVVLFALTRPLFGDWTWANSAGFAVGYLAYDMTHYSIHHFRHPQVSGSRRCKSTSTITSVTPVKATACSSPFWDVVFGTLKTQSK